MRYPDEQGKETSGLRDTSDFRYTDHPTLVLGQETSLTRAFIPCFIVGVDTQGIGCSPMNGSSMVLPVIAARLNDGW